MHICYMENYIGMVLTLIPQGGFLNSKDVSISIGLLEEEAVCWIKQHTYSQASCWCLSLIPSIGSLSY